MISAQHDDSLDYLMTEGLLARLYAQGARDGKRRIRRGKAASGGTVRHSTSRVRNRQRLRRRVP